MQDTSYANNLVNVIKQHIQQDIDEEYTNYKMQCLKDLDNKLELKRNSVVKDILNGIDVAIQTNAPYSLEPVITVKIEKKVYIKE